MARKPARQPMWSAAQPPYHPPATTPATCAEACMESAVERVASGCNRASIPIAAGMVERFGNRDHGPPEEEYSRRSGEAAPGGRHAPKREARQDQGPPAQAVGSAAGRQHGNGVGPQEDRPNQAELHLVERKPAAQGGEDGVSDLPVDIVQSECDPQQAQMLQGPGNALVRITRLPAIFAVSSSPLRSVHPPTEY